MSAVRDAYAFGAVVLGLTAILLVSPFVLLYCVILDAIERPSPEELARRAWRYG